MDPVGPDICVAVQPKRAAKKTTNMAPYRLEIAAEETPNARTNGSAITAAVNPPYISPFRFAN